MLLSQELLPAIREIAGDVFVFQQDGASAHRARENVELQRRDTPDFIAPDLWPPNSPDLNPVDYKIGGVMQERVYRTKKRDVADLKQRLIDTWSGIQIQQSIIDEGIDQFRRRLRACVQANGGHFEHLL